MFSPNVQQPRIPEIVDTLERTATPISGLIQGAIYRSPAGSRYLNSQNVFDLLQSTVERLINTPANWNSYGSPGPSTLAINQATEILHSLRAKLLQPERVLPSAEGGVSFVFVSDTISRAAVEALNSGESYVLLYDLNGNSETIDWPPTIADQLALVDRLENHLRSNGLATQGE